MKSNRKQKVSLDRFLEKKEQQAKAGSAPPVASTSSAPPPTVEDWEEGAPVTSTSVAPPPYGLRPPTEADDINLSYNERIELAIQREEEEARRTNPYYCDTFEQMELEEPILRGVYSKYPKPSRIQRRAVKAILTGRDCVIQSQAGTGKTAAFTIGILQKVDPTIQATQVIVVCPVRELTDQVQREINELGRHKRIKTSLVIGEYYLDRDILTSQVLICTPGRLIDTIQKGQINVEQVRMIVFDEADEILSENFKEQVLEIFQRVPESAQVVLVSATFSPEILELTGQFTTDPVRILIQQEEVKLKDVHQFYVNCMREKYKFEILMDIYKRCMFSQSIIFVNNKHRSCELASQLIDQNYTVLHIDSTMPQRERLRIMREFRNKASKILITTNLLARGIDIPDVNLVINYDLPNVSNLDTYIHRIGRCGRYYRDGVAINFIVPNEYYIIQNIRKYYSTRIDQMPEDINRFLVKRA